jgi:oligopeptide transport system substrate-binding protein
MQNVFKRKLGLDLRIDKQTFKQRLAKMKSGSFDLVAAGWGPDYDDPMTFADLFASWNENNHGKYANPEYDKQIKIAQNSADAKVRMDAMGKVQDIIIEDVVVLPQYERGVVWVLSPKVKGVVRTVFGGDPIYTYAKVKK